MKLLAALLTIALAALTPAAAQAPADPAKGEIAARPGTPAAGTPRLGLRRLGGDDLDPWLFVPKSYRADRPAPLLLVLHGAGGSGEKAIAPLRAHAERLGLILLAPSSSGRSWDIIAERSFGTDVAQIDSALADVFRQYAIDPERVAVAGFSDGASYALSIGIMNGSLFRRILAFSPGFMDPIRRDGKPAIFISHGTRDKVLPIDRASRQIVPLLKTAGYAVDYREFDGGHTVPDDLAREAYESLAR